MTDTERGYLAATGDHSANAQCKYQETFVVSNKEGSIRFEVKADAGNYEQAATKALRKLYGRRKLFARRTTGDHGKSGYFMAYRHISSCNAASSYGDPFHVM